MDGERVTSTNDAMANRQINRRRFLQLLSATAGTGSMLMLGAACQILPVPWSTSQTTATVASTRDVVILESVDANTLDPAFRNSTPELNINAHVFNMHTWRDARSLRIVPEFIQDWKIVNPLVWEFTIPTGVKFHDGSPADAEAVVFSLTRQAKARIGGRPTVPTWGRVSTFDGIDIVNSSTLRLKTKSPAPTVPDMLASIELVPPSVYSDESPESLAKIAASPVGSGPYRLVEWVKDDRVVLEAFPGYWGPKPEIPRVIIKPVPELSTRVLSLQNGQADLIVNVAPDQAEFLARDSNTRVSKVNGGRCIFVGMRVDSPLLEDKRVRQAFNYAFNFDGVNRSLLGGAGTRMKTIVNPPHEPPDAKPYPYDPVRAQALLADAGWVPGADGVLARGGERLSVEMMTPTGRYIKDKEIAQAIQQDLQRVGVEVKLSLIEWSVYTGDILAKRNPSPLFFLGLGTSFTGQDELNYIHEQSSRNSTYWQNARFHTLFDELKVELDPTKRQGLINEMSAIAYDDPPWIYVYHQVDFYGVSKRLVWEASASERIRMSEASLRQ